MLAMLDAVVITEWIGVYSTSIIVVLGVLLALLALWVIRLETRLSRLTKGQGGKNLESIITDTLEEYRRIERFQKGIEKYLRNIEYRLRRSMQGVETVRFNPFKGTGEGGNQSFATAFLNEKGDGLVISGIYARERMSVFSKPVQKYQSVHELSKEEEHVISKAKESLDAKHETQEQE